MNNVGKRIKSLREARGVTQDWLANKSNISKSFLSDVENGRRGISAQNLLEIAIVLETTIDFLMKDNESLNVEDGIQQNIEIPYELSLCAEEFGLSHKNTVTVLKTYNSLVARRSSNSKKEMDVNDWKKFYESIKEYL